MSDYLDKYEPVELQMAYHWICDKCSEANFALPIKAEMTDDDREEAYRLYHELDEWSDLPDDWTSFELWGIPVTVTCKNCSETFRTISESLE